ncbi:MAG: thioredoxin family protein [Dysgonamonadaceae bacterium]|jgi:hypothetical protein|nr:thioredoxin family protein [Dysgonamonadaceae bacterium]
MYKKLLFILLTVLPANAQNKIMFNVPPCAGQKYAFVLERGLKTDTVATGIFDVKGCATVNIPNNHTNYSGSGKLLLPDKGRLIVNMIINNEDSVTVNFPAKADNPEFAGSPENTAITDFIAEESQINEQYMPLAGQIAEMFPSDTAFLRISMALSDLKERYMNLNRRIAESPLYAARIMEIMNCMTFSNPLSGLTPEEIISENRKFITEKLDFADLLTSGFWKDFFNVWYETNMTNDSVLVNDARKMLDRTTDIEINRQLMQTFINTFSRYGREDLLPEIISSANIPINGKPAPAIINRSDTIFPKQTLILFYETGCGSCHNELHKLTEKYNILTNNHVEVISIAADIDEDTFHYTADRLPWTVKLCDLKGFDGENFINYGVVGTPTYILIDGEGTVCGRYSDLKKLIKD